MTEPPVSGGLLQAGIFWELAGMLTEPSEPGGLIQAGMVWKLAGLIDCRIDCCRIGPLAECEHCSAELNRLPDEQD